MSTSPAFKAFQRSFYSLLNSPWKLAVLVFGALVTLNSILELTNHLFLSSGEGIGKCGSLDFKDNIAGKSFAHMISAPIPIDIVYTWVNGSDPRLIESLTIYKKRVADAEAAAAEAAGPPPPPPPPPPPADTSPPKAPKRSLLTSRRDPKDADPAVRHGLDELPSDTNTDSREQSGGATEGTGDAAPRSSSSPPPPPPPPSQSSPPASNGTAQLTESEQRTHESSSASRFRDNNELRYSLRSLERFSPWVRNIYIVTNGQIPSWLDLSHPRVQVLSHADIFRNTSHLPTFSSPAIEANIHRIPGLSDKFIYFNDDVMFGNTVWPDDFYTHANGQKVYFAWAVPNCNEGCPASWINDGVCDQACNVSSCDFDGRDCVNVTQGSRYQAWWQNNNQHAASYSAYCSPGCPDSWIGDRYCDKACSNEACGWDASDCGIEAMDGHMHRMDLLPTSVHFSVPHMTPSSYVNLTAVYGKGRIVEGSHNNADAVRTATISQKHKVMTLTFRKNITLTDITVTIVGTTQEGSDELTTMEFNVTVNTRPTPPPLNVNGTLVASEVHLDGPFQNGTQVLVNGFLKGTLILVTNADGTTSIAPITLSNGHTYHVYVPPPQPPPLPPSPSPSPLPSPSPSPSPSSSSPPTNFTSQAPVVDTNREGNGEQPVHPASEGLGGGSGDSGNAGDTSGVSGREREVTEGVESGEAVVGEASASEGGAGRHLLSVAENAVPSRVVVGQRSLSPKIEVPVLPLTELFPSVDVAVGAVRSLSRRLGREYPNLEWTVNGPLVRLRGDDIEEGIIDHDSEWTHANSEVALAAHIAISSSSGERGSSRAAHLTSLKREEESLKEAGQEGGRLPFSPSFPPQVAPSMSQSLSRSPSSEAALEVAVRSSGVGLSAEDTELWQWIAATKAKALALAGGTTGAPGEAESNRPLNPPSELEVGNWAVYNQMIRESFGSGSGLGSSDERQRIGTGGGGGGGGSRGGGGGGGGEREGGSLGMDIMEVNSADLDYGGEGQGEGAGGGGGGGGGRQLLDIFGDSLKFVNRLYNRAFGQAPRKVPAHMPHMIDKNVMERLQQRWAAEFDRTSSHPFRAADDMQYSFSYFYFLIHETAPFVVDDFWKSVVDTNGDSLMSANELRTILARVMSSPLKASDVTLVHTELNEVAGRLGYPNGTWPFEVLNATTDLMKAIEKHYSGRPVSKHQVENTDEVAFHMIGDNDTEVLSQLDSIRNRGSKFICLNDNMNDANINLKVVEALQDFYEAYFPKPSQFELPEGRTNEFLYLEDYRAHVAAQRQRHLVFVSVGAVVTILGVWMCCTTSGQTWTTACIRGFERKAEWQRRETQSKRLNLKY